MLETFRAKKIYFANDTCMQVVINNRIFNLLHDFCDNFEKAFFLYLYIADK
jgi:hypothetical protein